MRIIRNGKVKVSNKQYYTCRNTKTILIDLVAKRAIIEYEGSDQNIPCIGLTYDKNTSFLQSSKHDYTELYFPEFKGWTIINSSITKYTLVITFWRGRK